MANYILVKIGILDINLTDKSGLVLLINNENEPILLEYIKEIKSNKYFIVNEPHPFYKPEYRISDKVSKIELGENFIMYDTSSSKLWQTSKVMDILSHNLFVTQNSVYYLKDINFFIKEQRENKLKQILNGKSNDK